MPPLTLKFREGLLWLEGRSVPAPLAGYFRRPPNGVPVSPAYWYPDILQQARKAGVELEDHASQFAPVGLEAYSEGLDPFEFQIEAIKAWEAAGRRGVVALPTGAGKSYVTRLLIARLGMKEACCPTLVVVPTRVLLYQWHAQLRRAFRKQIGMVGDDLVDIQPITVTTYASARIHMSWFGDRWKLIVFDEVHRKLSGGASEKAARCAIAPFRLGLTATPVETEQQLLNELVGPIVYQRTTEDLIDREVLSVYRRQTVRCTPAAEEVGKYFELRKPMDDLWHEARGAHRIKGRNWFVNERRLRPDAVALALRSVLRAQRYWGSIPSRILRLREILQRHIGDRVIIFAGSRASAYEISRTLLIPAITADIGPDEREVYLNAFAEGKCRALVTARALEEGVDLPDANVAVILAGRRKRGVDTIQYIQRRGRVLRKRAGKQAIVYEISWSLPRQKQPPALSG